jgi:hypothetical protein
MRAAVPALAALLLAAGARADIVFLNNGEELDGVVTKVDAQKVYLEADGRSRAFPRQDVLKIKLLRQWRVPGEDEPAQIADPALKALLAAPPKPEAYPDDGYLTARDETACELKSDLGAVCTRRKTELVLRERGKDRASNARFSYLDGVWTGRLDYARSVTGGKISYIDDTSIQEGSEFPWVPTYDRLKSTKFSIPNVSTGSVLDYRYRIEAPVAVSTYPFLGRMRFQAFEPSAAIRLTLVAPKGVALRYAERGLPKDARFSREEIGGVDHYVWEARDRPAFKSEDLMPPYPRLAPTVTYALADTWDNVAAAIAAQLQGRLEAGPDLAAKVADIVKGKESAERRVEALYNWVAKEIKHQPVPMNDFSFVPRPAADILRSKEGNDLDQPFLLFVMLRQAGFDPELVYMETKGGDPFEESLPSVRQFSAAAVRLDLGGRPVFLAPYDDRHRYWELPSQLQGMHGLVVLGAGKPGALVSIPLSAPEQEGEVLESRLALEADGSIKGSVTMKPWGGIQAAWRALKDYKKEDMDKWFEELAHGIHPNARLSSYSVENLDDPTRDLVVHYGYAVKDYAITAAGGFMAFRLPRIEHPATDVGQPSRESPMFWYERNRNASEVTVSLPAGYALYYVPEAVRLEGPECSYRAAYTPGAGSLAFSEEEVRGVTELAVADYAKYKAFREDMARFSEKCLVLKKK